VKKPDDSLSLNSNQRKESAQLTLWPLIVATFSVVRSDHEQILGMSRLMFGVLVVMAGFLAHGVDAALRLARPMQPPG